VTDSAGSLELTQPPVAATGMLIRKPVADVFEAFVDPAITSKFWFSEGSGRLAPGETVQWTWEMYDISIPVYVKEIEQDRRILIEWPADDTATTVEWLFTPRPDGTTFVQITNTGFRGNGDEVCRQACDATQGFSLVLAGLKALLEHGITLNLVPDRFPAGHEAT
jgi:uncharacterized protein YndB with AHSA1/START domain